MKYITSFLLLMLSMLGVAQIPPSAGRIGGNIIPQSSYVIPGYTGTVANVTTHKAKIIQGQCLWNSPVDYTYTATKSGNFINGEVVTGSVSGATGILIQDSGAGGASGILIIRPTSTAQFVFADTITGQTSNASVTTASQFQQSENYVVSPYKSNTGIALYNGQTTRRGASTNYASYSLGNSLYGTNSGIYACQQANRFVITGTVSGSPQAGEAVTQATSLATGRVLSVVAGVATIEESGTSPADFDNSHQINFTTSGANLNTLTALVKTANVWWLEWSPDGQNIPFKPALDTGSSSIYLAHQICDCGIIAGPITVASGTYSNTRVIWFGDYCEGNPSMYFNLPDKEPLVWHKMFTCRGTGNSFGAGGTQSIRHFHGAEFFPGFGAYEGRLYIMCGDNDYQAGIIYCDNVADMCNNPTNWGQYWGLTNVNGPARSSWASSATIYQQTLTYSSESAPFRLGERVNQGSNFGYVTADNGTNTLTINLDPSSGVFITGSLVTGVTTNSTTTPTVASSTTNLGGGLNYFIGVNPYPLAASASVTGTQGMGGQDSRAVEMVGDGINTITATWNGTFIVGDIMRQATSGAWGYLIGTGVNTLYIRPDASSVPFDGSHNITGSDSYITTSSVTKAQGHHYAYMIPDQAALSYPAGTFPSNDGYACPKGANIMRRIDINANTITTMAGRVHGEGFQGCLTPDGTILFQSESDFNGGTWAGNSDAYVHLYALTPDGSNLQEVSKWLRADYASPSGAVFFARCFYAFGAVWGWDINSNIFGGDSIVAFGNKPLRQYDQFTYNTITQPAFFGPNLFPDSKFGRSETNNEWRSSGSVGGAGVVPVSTITGLIPNFDTGMSSSAPNYVYKLIPSSSTGICLATYTFSVIDAYYLRGSFVTVSVWVYVPKASTNNPALQLTTGTGDVTQVPITPMDQWQRVNATIYINSTDQSLLVQLYARTSLSATDTTYSAWTDVEMIPGTQPAPSGTLGQESYQNQHDIQRLSTTVTYASANVTATYLTCRYKNITFSGTGGGSGRTFILPAVSANQGTNVNWEWTFTNSCDQIITVNINGSTGVAIGVGKTAKIKINAAGTDTLRVTPDT